MSDTPMLDEQYLKAVGGISEVIKNHGQTWTKAELPGMVEDIIEVIWDEVEYTKMVILNDLSSAIERVVAQSDPMEWKTAVIAAYQTLLMYFTDEQEELRVKVRQLQAEITLLRQNAYAVRDPFIEGPRDGPFDP